MSCLQLVLAAAATKLVSNLVFYAQLYIQQPKQQNKQTTKTTTKKDSYGNECTSHNNYVHVKGVQMRECVYVRYT